MQSVQLHSVLPVLYYPLNYSILTMKGLCDVRALPDIVLVPTFKNSTNYKLQYDIIDERTINRKKYLRGINDSSNFL